MPKKKKSAARGRPKLRGRRNRIYVEIDAELYRRFIEWKEAHRLQLNAAVEKLIDENVPTPAEAVTK